MTEAWKNLYKGHVSVLFIYYNRTDPVAKIIEKNSLQECTTHSFRLFFLAILPTGEAQEFVYLCEFLPPLLYFDDFT